MAIHYCPYLLLLFLTILIAELSAASETATPPASLSPSPPQTAPSPPQSPPSPPQPPLLPSQWQRQPPMLIRRRAPWPSRRRSPWPQRPPSRPPAPVTPPPPPPPAATEEQMKNIIDALIGSGDFGNWADLISGAVLPLSATLFVPENDAFPISSGGALPGAGDPYIVAYHVIPQRLTFPELQLFKTGTRLPTLLPRKSVVITNNSQLNFTIDGSPITLPDLYATAAFTIHGVGAVFDYSAYSGDTEQLDTQPNPRPDESQVVRPPPAQIPATGDFSGLSSDAAPPCLCIEFPVFLLAVCVVLGLKVQKNSFKSKP